MQIIKGKKKIRGVIYLLLCLLTVFVCWLFVGRNGVFGAKVDWISQHSVIPDYFRQQFYDTGELFPEFAANLGGGQNIYNFSYKLNEEVNDLIVEFAEKCRQYSNIKRKNKEKY